MKKLISAFLCTALLVTSAPVAFASAPENDNDTVTMIPTNEVTSLAINESFVLDDGAVLTRIPYDEYVRETATYNGVTEKEVIDSEPARAQWDGGGSYYYGYEKTQALDSNGWFNATLVATLRLYAYHGYGQIEGISDIKTRIASGLYLCKWEHDGSTSTPAENGSGYPCGSIDIAGNGHFYFDVSLNYNQQQTVEGCGFTAGGAAGVYWTSREMFIFGTYRCYSIPQA